MNIEVTTSSHFNDTTVTGIVVYTLFNKKLTKYYGNAFFREGIGVHGFKYQVGRDSNLTGRFYTTLSNGKEKRFQICSKPGIIYNTVVWYEQDADEEARELLLKYEESKIQKLEEEIVKCKDLADIIRSSSIINGF